MINYPHIASMVFGQPLFATPELIQAVKSVLEPRLLGRASAADQLPELNMSDRDEERKLRGVTIVGKLAIIPVHGVLVPRRGQIDAACTELLSYERLRDQIGAALRHELVEEIVLDFHTGGGAAMGCKEMADYIRAGTQIKPITALLNYAAYSAGYLMAAACSRIICSPTAGAGSIGVIIETYEVSKWEDEIGIKYNTFFRGGHKNDCSPHEPITDQAVIEIEKRLDKAYATFTESVAGYRGMDLQAVIDTEARLFGAEEALALNLIDEIAPAQDALDAIAQRYKPTTSQTRTIRAQAGAMETSCRL
jgi:signal peptide peptidase SppA